MMDHVLAVFLIVTVACILLSIYVWNETALIIGLIGLLCLPLSVIVYMLALSIVRNIKNKIR